MSEESLPGRRPFDPLSVHRHHGRPERVRQHAGPGIERGECGAGRRQPSAGCTAITSATEALKPTRRCPPTRVGVFKDKVAPVVDKVDTAISTLGSKLPGDTGAKVTDASEQLDEALAQADTNPQAPADKALEAVKRLNDQLATASTKLGCD